MEIKLPKNIILMITEIKLQILSKSVFLRIREIKYNEKFVLKENLYPGEYIIEIGKKIIDSNNNKKFNSFDEFF